MLAAALLAIVVGCTPPPPVISESVDRPAAPRQPDPRCEALADSVDRALVGETHALDLILVPVDTSIALPASIVGEVGAAVGRHFDTPSALPDSAMSIAAFAISRDGGTGQAQLVGASLSEALDRALLVAILHADSAGAFSGPGRALPRDTVLFMARVIARSEGRKSQVRALGANLESGFEFPIEKPAIMLPGQPPPRYPEDARARGIAGEVLIAFVVNEKGRPLMQTAHVIKATHEDFVKAVMIHLPTLRFRPAELRGCPIKMWVQMPFNFAIAPAPPQDPWPR